MQCGRCDNVTRWWTTHYRDLFVCMICYSDPLDALECLARRKGQAAVYDVQRWRKQYDELPTRSA